MNRHLAVVAYGVPTPQGSSRAMINHTTGRAIMIANNRTKNLAWRETVAAACLDAMDYGWQRFEGPVSVSVWFYFDRPKGHYGTGRNAAALKASAPFAHTTKPDVDKLSRSLLDALTSCGVFRDDSQVADLAARKRYVDPTFPRPGAHIVVRPLTSVTGPGDTETAAVAPIGEALDATAAPTPTLFD